MPERVDFNWHTPDYLLYGGYKLLISYIAEFVFLHYRWNIVIGLLQVLIYSNTFIILSFR